MLNGVPAAPTPVVSGSSPVTPGDMAYAVERCLLLSRPRLCHLALGSVQDPHACGVCVALRGDTHRYTDDERQAADELLAWHGNDGLRCGVIYGIAAGLIAPALDETQQPTEGT